MNRASTERLLLLRAEVDRVCQTCHRDPAQIRIIAVSKTQEVEAVRAALEDGFKDFGENRVQEAEVKIAQIQPRPVWHLVGHLQTNKAARAVSLFDWVQSVDSVRLAVALGSGAIQADKKIGVLVQVNTTAEGQKSGCEPGQLGAVVESVLAQPGLRLAGLMTMGPLSMTEVDTRKAFQIASDLRETWRGKLPTGTMDVLSMGMSGDWPWAILHGADWIRLGTAIFGAR